MQCTHCQHENQASAQFCTSCGTVLELEALTTTGMRGEAVSGERFVYDKSPLLAATLSFFVVGMGQLYNGDAKKGLLMFFGVIAASVITLGLAWFPFVAWSMIDAYRVAKGAVPLWA